MISTLNKLVQSQNVISGICVVDGGRRILHNLLQLLNNPCDCNVNASGRSNDSSPESEKANLPIGVSDGGILIIRSSEWQFINAFSLISTMPSCSDTSRN